MKLKTCSALKSCMRSPPACLHKPTVNTVITMCCRCWQHMKFYPHVQRWMSHNCDIFSKMLLVVTDWQLLLVSAVGENLIGASVFGFLLYGAYKVCGYLGMRVLPEYLWIFKSWNSQFGEVRASQNPQIRCSLNHEECKHMSIHYLLLTPCLPTQFANSMF